MPADKFSMNIFFLQFHDKVTESLYIETYIQEHSEADFSHGICPECAATLYPDIELYGDNS